MDDEATRGGYIVSPFDTHRLRLPRMTTAARFDAR
jgi:hypothetical protein